MSELHFNCPHCGTEQSAIAEPGAQIRCGSCGSEFTLGSEATAAVDDSPAEGDETRRGSGFLIMALMLAFGLFIACGVLAVVLIRSGRIVSPSKVTKKDPDGDFAVKSRPDESPSGKQVAWSQAPRVFQRRQLWSVGVPRATFDVVRGKNEKKQVITSPEPCLAIHVKVENMSIESRHFQSWREAAVHDGVVLIDNQGHSYPAYAFKGAVQVQGGAKSGPIAARDEVSDVLLFQAPESVDRASVRYLRLQLPAAACGMNGVFRFEIGSSMIDGDW